ncbi:hypothetical protein ACVWZ6_003249 [Bradyrhizobium sp. GM6.1]|jgi:hypothetical protein
MKRLVLTAVALFVTASTWGPSIWAPSALAQGVNDPSTPNRNVIIVNPSQPAPSTATRNIPSQIQPPLISGGRARPYYGNRTRGSGSSRR